jgi:hypothetical protein
MALDCGLNSVRGTGGENYEKWFAKIIERKILNERHTVVFYGGTKL